MFQQPNTLFFIDIHSWWEVPSIAHFCSLFRVSFDLLDFDIEVTSQLYILCLCVYFVVYISIVKKCLGFGSRFIDRWN